MPSLTVSVKGLARQCLNMEGCRNIIVFSLDIIREGGVYPCLSGGVENKLNFLQSEFNMLFVTIFCSNTQIFHRF